jgi:hypothetical protein
MENVTIPQNMPCFATKEEAFEWMVEKVDDPYIDNYRFAFVDDMEQAAEYEEKADSGCCGSADYDIMVGGRRALVGCNYGH